MRRPCSKETASVALGMFGGSERGIRLTLLALRDESVGWAVETAMSTVSVVGRIIKNLIVE